MHGKNKYSAAKDILAICIRFDSAFKQAQIKTKFISSTDNINRAYKPVSEFVYELSNSYVHVKTLWGEKEAKLIQKLISRIYELDFIASSYERSTDQEKMKLAEMAKAILDGENQEWTDEVKLTIKEIENKFEKFVR